MAPVRDSGLSIVGVSAVSTLPVSSVLVTSAPVVGCSWSLVTWISSALRRASSRHLNAVVEGGAPLLIAQRFARFRDDRRVGIAAIERVNGELARPTVREHVAPDVALLESHRVASASNFAAQLGQIPWLIPSFRGSRGL